VHRKNILVHIEQDATLRSLLYLKTALHVSGGTSTHHQKRKQLYLQHLLFVTPLLLPAAIASGSSNFFFFRWRTARCEFWPVEQYLSICPYLSPTLSIFSLPALENLFPLLLSILSWAFLFVSSLPVLE
jgi:hypothetical protein